MSAPIALRAGHRSRSVAEIMREIADAATAMQTTTRSWSTLPPSPGAIADVDATAEGIRRALVELRVHAQGGDDAA